MLTVAKGRIVAAFRSAAEGEWFATMPDVSARAAVRSGLLAESATLRNAHAKPLHRNGTYHAPLCRFC